MDKIMVLVKQPGKSAASMTIPNEMEEFQRLVGGYIETVTLSDKLVLICNEEGRLFGLPYNCTINGIPFVGDIVVAAWAGDDFCDMTTEALSEVERISELWRDGYER